MTENKTVGTRDKDVPWYEKESPNVTEETRELLESYSKIPADEVISHLQKIRDEAWDIFPYPCIGSWRFIELSIGTHPLYSDVRSRLRTGNETYLDLGCCFGQDIRRLVADGVPSTSCYGSDLQQDFMQLGYKMFLDSATLKATFIEGDVFNPSSDLSTLDGKVDIIHAASFFHLFDWDQQKQVAHRVVKLLKPKKDSLVLGRQVGNADAGHQVRSLRNNERSVYRHNEESWARLWKEVGEETQTEWECQTQMRDWKGSTGSGPEKIEGSHMEGVKRMQFSVRRLG